MSFLDEARRAVYRAWSLRELDPGVRERAFREVEPGRFALLPRLRDMVTFRTVNLIDAELPGDEEFAGVDLIVCRNVLIYLAPKHQRVVARRIASRLGAEGWLAVAPAEAIAAWFRPLMPVNLPSAIFFRAEPPAARVEPRPEPPAVQRRAVPHARPAATIAPTSNPASMTAPVDRPEQIARIRTFADLGDLASARAACEALLAADRLDHDVQLLLGLICQEQDDAPAALEASRCAIYVDPASAAAHFLCATSLQQLARTGQARREMEIVLRLLDGGASLPPEIPLEQLRTIAAAYLGGATSGRRGAASGIA